MNSSILYGLHCCRYLRSEAERLNPRTDPCPLEERGYSDLHMAVYNGDHEEMQRLLDKGFNVCIKDNYGKTSLHLAAGLNDPVATEILLRRGIERQENSYSTARITPIIVAVRTKSVLSLKMFVKYGCKVDGFTCKPSCLVSAIRLQDVEMVKILLQGGADPNILDATDENRFDDEYTPLHWACFFGNLEIVQVLLDHGADFSRNRSTYEDQLSPLQIAVSHGHEDVLDLLVRNGADLKHRDQNGEGLLHFAVMASQAKIFYLLIDRGLDVHVRTRSNESLLHYAMIGDYSDISITSHYFKNRYDQERIKIIKTLVGHGLKVDEKDSRGRAVITYAVLNDNKETVLYALLRGANVHEKNLVAESRHGCSYPRSNKCLLDRAVELGRSCIGPLLAFGIDYSKLYKNGGDYDRPEVLEVFAKYFKKRIVAQLFVNAEDKELVMRHDLDDFEKSCVAEMEEMRKVRLYEETTLFDLMQTKTKRGLVAHAQKPEVRDFVERRFDYGKFPIYEDIVVSHYAKGKRYIPVYDVAIESLRVICQFTLADLIVEKILFFLDYSDAMNVLAAVNKRPR